MHGLLSELPGTLPPMKVLAPMTIFLRSERFRRLSKEGFWIVLGQTAVVVGSLVGVRLLTGLLDPAAYGELALGMTLTTLVNQVVMGGVTAGIGRFYSIAAEKRDLPGYLSASWRFLFYATLAVLTIGLVLLVGLYYFGYSQWMGLATAALVFSVLGGYNSALSGMQNAARQRAIAAFHGGLDAWLKILLAVGVMVWLGTSSTAVVIGYICSTLLVTVSQLFFLRRMIPHQNMHTAHHHPWIGQMWAYSWPMLAGGLFNWGYYASQRWSLELFTATEEVGKFYALTQIAYTPISMVGAMFLSFLTPILFARTGDAANTSRVQTTHRVVMRIGAIGLASTVLVVITCYFYHDFIFGILVAAQYRSLSVYMPYVVFAAGILQISMILAILVAVENNTRRLLPLAIFGNGIVILINFYAASEWGLSGLVASMVFGACLHLAWMLLIVLPSTIQIFTVKRG
jgi:O-antigen/teichoic acid export membrane protein